MYELIARCACYGREEKYEVNAKECLFFISTTN